MCLNHPVNISIPELLVYCFAPPLFLLNQDPIVKLQAMIAIFTWTSVDCLETQATSLWELEVYSGPVTPVVMAIYWLCYRLATLWV